MLSKNIYTQKLKTFLFALKIFIPVLFYTKPDNLKSWTTCYELNKYLKLVN